MPQKTSLWKLFVYYGLPVVVAGLITFSFFQTSILRTQGSFAIAGTWLLFLLMVVKPIAMILNAYNKSQKVWLSKITRCLGKIIELRKELGIICCWVLFVHGIFIIIARFNFLSRLTSFGGILGIVGLVALIIGAATSNNRSLKFFKDKWKPIQSVAYIALVTGLLHAGMYHMSIAYYMLFSYLVLKIREFVLAKKYRSLYLYFFILSLIGSCIAVVYTPSGGAGGHKRPPMQQSGSLAEQGSFPSSR